MAKKMGAQQQLHSSTPLGLIFMMIIVVIGAGIATAAAADDDSNKDREECAEQLAGLATCLPYVGGNAKAPTPDCCTGLKQVLKNSDKCLCVIIRDRNDPDLGLNINLTLALGLPSVCHAPANVSKCPELLHLPPNSPDAQVFYQFGKSSNSSGAPAPAPSAATSSAAGTSSARQQQQQQSSGSGGWNGKGGCCWLELQLLCVGGILLWCLSSSSSAYHFSQLSFM